MDEDIRHILKKYWGFDNFRPLQTDIILSVLKGQDTLALLPTGGGKSICFQVPALAKEGICIVVSPLIALMKDQVENLKNKGINAYAIHSGLSYREVDILLDNCIYGDIKFLYVSPERLKNEIFIERFKKMKVNLIAVDEAHCISQWGYDFRPPYLDIAELRQWQPKATFIALTATATAEVADDIQKKLEFKKSNILRKSFKRENLAYVVLKEENKMQRLFAICNKIAGTGIIYVRNRKQTKEIANFLRNKGISADFYHAGLTNEARNLKQEQWKQNKTRIIVATNAFGMGIDKPDVRFVIHMDLPESIEAYFQEAGRGGRDEKKAFALLLWNDADIKKLEEAFEQRFPPISILKDVYAKLVNHLQLPMGSAYNETYNFELNLFCDKYKLPVLQVFNALKLIEKEGYLQLNDAVYNPSKLMIIVNKQELYKFQVEAEKYDAFIKLLLRSYSGLFDSYVTINEAQLAKRTNVDKQIIVTYLEKLQQQRIIDYKPANQNPTITFTSEIADAKHLFIDHRNYKTIKESALKRIEAVKYFITQSNRCRSEILLSYFGEKEQQKCGVCDFCIEDRKQAKEKEAFDKAIAFILPLIGDSPMTISELLKGVKYSDEKTTKRAIQWLLDNGKAHFDKNEKLTV